MAASLYNLPLIVLKSSASASDADSAKIANAVCEYFMAAGFCLFSSPHGNDKVLARIAQT
jgi:hypothetical protein